MPSAPMAPLKIKNVALVGATGNLGPHVLGALLSCKKFNVTIVARHDTKSRFPPGLTVKKANIWSRQSLAAAFRGQDAVVSCVGFDAAVASDQQIDLIDAALMAGVKRFIPSEFAGDTTMLDSDSRLGWLLKQQKDTLDYLDLLAEDNEWFSWTALSVGFLFDWALKVGTIGANLKTKTASVVDSGDRLFRASTADFVGRAVVSILSQPEKTANKFLRISEFIASQNELLEIAEKETGSKFEVQRRNSADLELAGDEKVARCDYHLALADYQLEHECGDRVTHQAIRPQDSDNRLLDLKGITLKDAVRGLAQEL